MASRDKQILPEDSQTALAESEEMRGYTELQENELEYVDVICGGFPCQDISVAGRGEGIHGSRSGLWKEMLRIICELRPRYVIVENVPALLGRGIDVVLGDLASCGYDAEWDCIPASAFGAPHQRDRVWIVAYTRSERRQQIPRGSSCNEETNERRASKDNYEFECNGQGNREEDVADTENTDRGRTNGQEYARRRHQEIGGCSLPSRRSEYWRVEPDMGRVAHGVPNRVDRLRALGNACVPQIAEWIGRRIIDAEEGH